MSELHPLFHGSQEARALSQGKILTPLAEEAFVVEYHCNDHTHWAAAPKDEGYEGAALQLVEDMEKCQENWGYRGEQYRHDNEQVKDAFGSAITQVLTRNIHAEFAELQWKKRMFKKWGGHMPSVVAQPRRNDPEQWEAIIPDSDGTPHIYDVPDGAMRELPLPGDVGARRRRLDSPLGGFIMPRKENKNG